MKDAADQAVADTSTIEHVLVVRRTGIDVPWRQGRDVWWHDVVDSASPEHRAEAFDAEHPLFLLYTSGTTGKPKGIVHTSGGYLTQASYTHYNVFDIKPDTDVFWCTADIGWVTGHTYGVYAPLSNGVTTVIYEGTPSTPSQHRHFQIIEKYGVTIYYTAPTMIRTFMKWGREIPDAHDLSSLRLLGTVGEPINPEAWRWYRKVIGADSVPIVDTWWQTETGAAMISPLPGVAAAKPGSAMRPLPGISARIVDDNGNQLSPPSSDEGEHTTGYLVLDQPWPSMLRGIWGDPDRFRETYWSKFAEQGWYFAGDGARYDPDGAIWILGRIDDVMNVSGHRISTAEVESALVGHAAVVEAAVVGATDDDHRSGDLRLRCPAGKSRADDRRGDHRRAAGRGRSGDFADRPATRTACGARIAEDPQRQDHATPAAGHRREARTRRHLHAARSGRVRRDSRRPVDLAARQGAGQ